MWGAAFTGRDQSDAGAVSARTAQFTDAVLWSALSGCAMQSAVLNPAAELAKLRVDFIDSDTSLQVSVDQTRSIFVQAAEPHPHVHLGRRNARTNQSQHVTGYQLVMQLHPSDDLVIIERYRGHCLHFVPLLCPRNCAVDITTAVRIWWFIIRRVIRCNPKIKDRLSDRIQVRVADTLIVVFALLLGEQTLKRDLTTWPLFR
jgi:hypothetical protein